MMYKQKNKQEGITLIALIVTIIVLIVLAGVSISMVVGDNGIITQAQRAKEETDLSIRKESSTLTDYEDLMEGKFVEIKQTQDTNPGNMEGSGTQNNPYIINSIEDLVSFANLVKEGNTFINQYVQLGISLDFYEDKSYVDLNKKYILNNTINGYEESENGEKTLKELLTTGQGWLSIGNTIDSDNQNFEGTFEGNNKVIKNLYMAQSTQESSVIGLFANNKGIIQNLKVLNAQIEVNGKDDTYIFIGSICGNNQGNMINCETSGKVSMEANFGLMSGITGRNQGEIIQCKNYTKLQGRTMYAGGIAAQNLGRIENCANLGEIIEETYGNYTGGITGSSLSSSSSIVSSYNTGNIYVMTGESIVLGGIAGQSQNPITACYNAGNINVEADNVLIRVGGIAGYYNNILKNSYNLGSINLTGTAEGKMGGIVGELSQGTVQYCYNEGKLLSSDTSSSIGGIIGYVPDNTISITLSDNYYLNNIEKGIGYILNDNELYTTVKENEMDKDDLLILLNTDNNLWKNDNDSLNNGYPILVWQ